MPKPTQIPVHIDGLDKPVYFPATMQPDEIERAIENDVLPRLRQPAPPLQPLTRGERFSRGFNDVIEGLGQKALQLTPDQEISDRDIAAFEDQYGAAPGSLKAELAAAKAQGKSGADIVTEGINQRRAEYAERRGPNAGIDWMRIGGNVAGTAPAMLLPGGAQTTIGRIGAGALSGAIVGSAQFDPSNTLAGAAKNVAVGAGTGAVAAPIAGKIGDLIGAAARKIAGRFAGASAGRAGKINLNSIEAEIPELAQLPPQVKQGLYDEAVEQLRTTGALNAEQLSRKANLIANGVTPTKSMVTRDPIDWTVERNLQKMGQSPNDPALQRIGGELSNVYKSNDQALAGQLTNIQSPLPKGTTEQLGESALRGIGSVADKSQKAVRAGYEAIDDTVGNELASDARNVFSVITDPKYLYNPRSKPLVEATRDYLKHMGMIDKGGSLTTKTLTAKETEQLRQFVNTLDDTFGRGAIIKAIDDDAVSGLGKDAYGAAREAAKTRFAALDNPAAQRALNTLGELQQGKTAQNFIRQQVIGGADQDVASLLKTLQSEPAAIDSIKSGVLRELQKDAVNVNSGKFSGAKFNDAVQSLGTKLDMIFGKKSADQIRSLARAAVDATYEPAYSAVNNSNSGVTVMASLADKLRRTSKYLEALPAGETLRKVAAENAAQKQLQEALAAQSTAPALSVDPNVKRLVDALTAAGAPSAVAGVNSARNRNKKGSGNE